MDSNVLIDYAGRKFSRDVEEKLDSIFDEVFHYSIISRLEVLGYNAPANILQSLEEFLATGEMHDISEDIANQTILIKRPFPRIKLPDVIIAATALAHNHTLLTRNTDDFKNIPGLRLDNPWQW